MPTPDAGTTGPWRSDVIVLLQAIVDHWSGTDSPLCAEAGRLLDQAVQPDRGPCLCPGDGGLVLLAREQEFDHAD